MTYSPLQGSYESSDKSSRCYQPLTNRKIFDVLDSNQSSFSYCNDIDSDQNDVNSNNNNNNNNNNNSFSSNMEVDLEKRQRTDKQDTKKRWVSISKLIDSFSDKSSSDLIELNNILEELYNLPPYVESPGECFMNGLQPKIKQILSSAQLIKSWLSSYNDVVFKIFELNRSVKYSDKIHQSFTQEDIISIKNKLSYQSFVYDSYNSKNKFYLDLKELLELSKNTTITLEEEKILNVVISKIDNWHSFASSLVNKGSEKLFKNEDEFAATKLLLSLIQSAFCLPLLTLDKKLFDLFDIYSQIMTHYDDLSNLIYQSLVLKNSSLLKKSTFQFKFMNLNQAKDKLNEIKAIHLFKVPGIQEFEALISSCETWCSQVSVVSDSTVSLSYYIYLSDFYFKIYFYRYLLNELKNCFWKENNYLLILQK